MSIIRAALVGCVSLGLLSGCAVTIKDSAEAEGWDYRKGSGLELTVMPGAVRADADGGSPVIGTWTGEGRFAAPPVYSQRYYAMEVRRGFGDGVSRRVEVRSMAELEGLPTEEGEYDERLVTLRLRRDAGTIVFVGEKVGNHAQGNVRFERDEGYATAVAALAGRSVDASELAGLAFVGVKRGEIEDLLGTGRVFSPVEVIRLKDNGVSSGFMRDLAAGGRSMGIDDAITLRRAGVSADYVKELGDAGLEVGVEDTIRLKRNGVRGSFVKGLAADGGELPGLDEIVRLRNSGVSSQYIVDLRAAGYRFTTDEVLRLSNSSISASFATGIREAGYDLGVDDLVRLRNNAVSSQYVKELQEPGYERLSIDQIIEARRKGLSAEFVRALRRKE